MFQLLVKSLPEAQVADIPHSGSLFGNRGLCNASLCVSQFLESLRLVDTTSTVCVPQQRRLADVAQ